MSLGSKLQKYFKRERFTWGGGLRGRKEGRLANKGPGKDLFGFVCPFCQLFRLGLLQISLWPHLAAFQIVLATPPIPWRGKRPFIWWSCRLPFGNTNPQGHSFFLFPIQYRCLRSAKACTQTQQMYLGKKMARNLSQAPFFLNFISSDFQSWIRCGLVDHCLLPVLQEGQRKSYHSYCLRK